MEHEKSNVDISAKCFSNRNGLLLLETKKNANL